MASSSPLARWIPAVGWLRSYSWSQDAPGDLTAGLTVAVMLIPQGMAYAMLAGLPPIVGLYASIFPMVAYAILGSSRQLAVGPVAMDSLLVATTVGALAAGGSQRYLELAVLLAGMVGIYQLAMGSLRLGFLVEFLSRPVIAGFTSAAALIIGLSQLKHLVGANIPRSPLLPQLAYNAATHAHEVKLLTLLLGVVAIAMLLAIKRMKRRIPGALVVVVVGTVATWLLGLDGAGVAVVGTVPSGIPSPSVPTVSWGDVQTLAGPAATIALVAFMEAISVAKAVARRHRYEVDANQELLGLGASNVAAFFFRGYPVTGGFSRTAVNDQAGARTPMAAVVTAAAIALSLLFLTPLFYFLPKAALAAIVMVAVFGLFKPWELVQLWKIKKTDAVLWFLTFVTTLAVGIQLGILMGVVASLGLFIQRSTRPHTAELGRLPGTRHYRNLKNFPEAQVIPGLRIVRMDASLYFANAGYFRDQIDHLLVAREGHRECSAVLVDASSINDLDASGEQTLREIAERLRDADIELYFAHVKGPVRTVMKRGALWQQLGDERFFFDVHEAVEAIVQREANVSWAPPSGDGDDAVAPAA